MSKSLILIVLFFAPSCADTQQPDPVSVTEKSTTPRPQPAPQHVMDALKIRDRNRAAMRRPTPKPNLELLESRATGDSFSMTITGRIRNNTTRNYTYVQALFNVFDSEGNRVGSAIVNINNLRATETWKFKAVYFGSDGKQFNLNKIEGY